MCCYISKPPAFAGKFPCSISFKANKWNEVLMFIFGKEEQLGVWLLLEIAYSDTKLLGLLLR
jgi:hypothetical protein